MTIMKSAPYPTYVSSGSPAATHATGTRPGSAPVVAPEAELQAGIQAYSDAIAAGQTTAQAQAAQAAAVAAYQANVASQNAAAAAAQAAPMQMGYSAYVINGVATVYGPGDTIPAGAVPVAGAIDVELATAQDAAVSVNAGTTSLQNVNGVPIYSSPQPGGVPSPYTAAYAQALASGQTPAQANLAGTVAAASLPGSSITPAQVRAGLASSVSASGASGLPAISIGPTTSPTPAQLSVTPTASASIHPPAAQVATTPASSTGSATGAAQSLPLPVRSPGGGGGGGGGIFGTMKKGWLDNLVQDVINETPNQGG